MERLRASGGSGVYRDQLPELSDAELDALRAEGKVFVVDNPGTSQTVFAAVPPCPWSRHADLVALFHGTKAPLDWQNAMHAEGLESAVALKGGASRKAERKAPKPIHIRTNTHLPADFWGPTTHEL